MAHTRLDGPSDPRGSGVLDAAQGPLHPLAAQTLQAAIEAAWADPDRLHAPGRRARALLDTAREVLAGALGVRPGEVSVHPSAADALVTGLHGLLHARRRTGSRVVASAVERSVVLLRSGAEEAVPVDTQGRVDTEAYERALRAPGVAAAVLQSANGEVGTRQPVAHLAVRAEQAGVPLLLDATASVGRDPLDPAAGAVVVADAATFGGPPLGLLGVRSGTRWGLAGPGRDGEHGRTLAPPWVPLVLGAAEAWRQTEAARDADARAAVDLVERIRRAAAALPDVEVLGDPADRLPHVVTFSVLLTDGEALVEELARRGVAVASGSACTSSALRPSHVLSAMGVLTHGNIRVTLPLESVSPARDQDVERLCTELGGAVTAVRRRMGTLDL